MDTYKPFESSYDSSSDSGTALLEAPVKPTRSSGLDDKILGKIGTAVKENPTLAREYTQHPGE